MKSESGFSLAIASQSFRGSQILSLRENVGAYSWVGEDAVGAKTSLLRRSTHCILHHHVAALSGFLMFQYSRGRTRARIEAFSSQPTISFLQVYMSSSTTFAISLSCVPLTRDLYWRDSTCEILSQS